MKFSLSLSNFRCFASVGPINIAPLTVLVGENSTGKTSFLAALRIAVESFARPFPNAFNREPYFLGSFEQIAHYRGGRSGRAKAFTVKIEQAAESNQADLFGRKVRQASGMSHELSFVKGSGQPEIHKYVATVGNAQALFDLSGSRPKVTISQPGLPPLQIDPERSPSSLALRQDVSFFGFYLQDMLLRSSKGEGLYGDDKSDAALRSLASALRSSSRSMGRSVFASAPVRIQPRRVYTPSELNAANVGEQVPLEMANLKLSSPDSWQKTKSQLNRFGQKSGLFEDIDVKRLGKTDSDPFQIQVKNQGPASNIVDVGYGVSQALPLLYPLYNNAEYDFFLLQQPEVHLHPKAQAEFGSLITSISVDNPLNNYVIETHSDFILDRIRSEVRRGSIAAGDVAILLFRRKGLEVEILQLSLTEKGDVANFPDDYREFFLHEHARILGLA